MVCTPDRGVIHTTTIHNNPPSLWDAAACAGGALGGPPGTEYAAILGSPQQSVLLVLRDINEEGRERLITPRMSGRANHTPHKRSKKCGSEPTALTSGWMRRNSSRARVPPFFTPMMMACGNFLLPKLLAMEMLLDGASPPPRDESDSCSRTTRDALHAAPRASRPSSTGILFF
ncbi:hypothetical protein EYF80_034873 [Liparis tanakae]|uniref:Uncharacterized protein n=1 Tax=Liparis tanakae TaxID=230148 RepID=A0A4Z2GMS6_9TELE|nr:hypothetical protein EYF80_034873 [Liparis tanakae]